MYIPVIFSANPQRQSNVPNFMSPNDWPSSSLDLTPYGQILRQLKLEQSVVWVLYLELVWTSGSRFLFHIRIRYEWV